MLSLDPSVGPLVGGIRVVVTTNAIPPSFQIFFGTAEAEVLHVSSFTIEVMAPPCGEQCPLGTTTVRVIIRDTSRRRAVDSRASGDLFTYVAAGVE